MRTDSPAAGPALPPGLALAGAVVAVSTAAPLVRFSTADALVISAWRLLFSVAFIGLVLLGRRSFLAGVRLRRRDLLLALGAGVLLAGHFWAFFAAVQLTSVASSVVLVNTQPLLVAWLSLRLLREPPSLREWVGVGVAVVGAAVIGWGDFRLGGRALLGDLLALGAAVLVGGYYVAGRRLRQSLDVWSYTALVYGAAALVLAGVVGFRPSLSLLGYPTRDWLVFLGLAAVPMMLGHTGINYALRYYRAHVANLAAMGEPVGATLLAWLLPGIGEVPSGRVVAGGILVLVGIGIGTFRRA